MGGSRQSSHTGICSKTLLTSFKCLWWAQHFLLIHWPAWWTCYWCEPVSYLTSANKLGRVLGGQMVGDAGLHRPDSCNRVQSRKLTSKIACKNTNITCVCYHYWNTAQVHMITYIRIGTHILDTRKFVKFCCFRLSHRWDSSMNQIPSEQFTFWPHSNSMSVTESKSLQSSPESETWTLQFAKMAGAQYGGSKSTQATFTKP